MSEFSIDWVIKNKIAIGRSPSSYINFSFLKSYKIKSILTLCDLKEVSLEDKDFERFIWRQIVLPDHTYEKKLKIRDLDVALRSLNKLINYGPVFVHCKAGRERSPLVCMAWLMQNKNLSLDSALIYLRQVHPGSNPMLEHLNLLKNYFSKKDNS